MKRFFVATLLVLAFGASGTKADSKSGSIDNPKQIPDSIVISANRFPTAIEKTASSVTVISEEEINKSQTVMVSELLKQVPGLDVVRSGGAGTQTSVFMRGTNSNHTLVIIDGVEMNNPSSPSTSFDFGSLNVNNIQRIEVLRGPQSVMYGSDAVGGVIQIFTKRGFGDLQAEVVTEAGSYKTFSESIHLNGSEEKIDYSLFLSRKDIEGFSTIGKKSDHDEKDGFKSTDLIANIGVQIYKEFELLLNGRISNATADIDGYDPIFYNPNDDPNNVSENKIKSFGLRLKSFNKEAKYFNPEISVAFLKQDIQTINKEDATHAGEFSESNTHGKRYKISSLNSMRIFDNTESIIGIEYEKETFSSDDISSSFWAPFDTNKEVSASTFSLYGLDDWAVNEQFSLSGGLRYDDHETFGSQMTFRFTSLYNFPKAGFTLKGTYGTAFKAPSLFQLNDSTYGNPNLQPEENKGWELGFVKSSPNNIFKFGATYFSNEIDNLISLVYNPTDFSFLPYNIAEATTEGVEAFAQVSFPNGSLRINMTYTEVKDLTNQSNIIRRPKEKISLQLQHKLSNELQVSLLINTVGNRFDTDFSNSEEVVLEGYTVVNFTSAYQLIDNVSITGRVDNLFNKEYQDVLLYNTPDRSGYLGLRISL